MEENKEILEILEDLLSSTNRIAELIKEVKITDTDHSERIATLYNRRNNKISKLKDFFSDDLAKVLLNSTDNTIKKKYNDIIIREKANLEQLKEITKEKSNKIKELTKQKSLLVYLEGDKK